MSDNNPYLHRRTEVRCPHCSAVMDTEESVYSRKSLVCAFCQRAFKVRDAESNGPKILQDPGGGSHSNEPAASDGMESFGPDDPGVTWTLIIALTLISGVGISGCFVGHEWDGIAFLFFYAFAFFVLMLSATTIRHAISDRYVVSIVCFLLFEGIGLSRIGYGLANGMHNFTFLIIMMVVGGLFFFMRSKSEMGGHYGFCGGCGFHFGYGSGAGGGMGCSGCSGCGGGGCGGCGS